jgi:hypothetical protein
MRERPILFSGPMIRALLDGTKTQTRRVVKPQPDKDEWSEPYWFVGGFRLRAGNPNPLNCPYGVPGDRLWVRETWGPCAGGVCYRASEHITACPDGGRWRPSIFMPRWVSRITLTITDVRVERLQNISAEDAMAEGLVPWSKDGKLTKYGVADPDGMPGSDYAGTWPWHEWRISPADAYQKLWDDINAARGFGWDANPWVWAISFTRETT